MGGEALPATGKGEFFDCRTNRQEKATGEMSNALISIPEFYIINDNHYAATEVSGRPRSFKRVSRSKTPSAGSGQGPGKGGLQLHLSLGIECDPMNFPRIIAKAEGAITVNT